MEAVCPVAVEWFKEANIAHYWCFKLMYLLKQLYKMVARLFKWVSLSATRNEATIRVKVCVGCGGYLVCSDCKLLCLHDQHVYLIHILLYKCRNWITTCQHSLGFSKSYNKIIKLTWCDWPILWKKRKP